MHCKPTFIVSICLLVTMAAIGARANAPLPNQSGTSATENSRARYIPDRVLVQLKTASASRLRLKSGTTAPSAVLGIPSLDAISAQVGAINALPAIERFQDSSQASALGLDTWVLIHLSPGSDVEAAVAAYNADPNVDAASPDYTFQLLVTPNDPLYPLHWGHNNTGQFRTFNWNQQAHTGPALGTVGFDMNAEAGWTGPTGFGSPSVIIAIIDTGVNLSHPDLTVVDGYDFGDNDSNSEDDSALNGHGTGCAGLAASKANNGIGACGPAAGCSIMPMKVSNSAGQFGITATANAIVWATDHGADIISMSFGLFIHGNGIPVLDAAIEYANAASVVMFAGTGNNNAALMYPASHAHVIGVGAASPCGDRKRSASNPAFLSPGVAPDPNNYSCDGERFWGSSFGPATPDAPDAVDILAPTMLPTTDIQGPDGFASGNYSSYFNGTSCSTPVAAGVAALIKSKHPDWTSAQIRQQLLTSAQDVISIESGAGWDRYSGYGMVDIYAAVGCSATPVIVGNGAMTVGAGETCCVTIHPADLITSVSDPDGDEDIVSVRITNVDGTDVNVDSTLVCGLGNHSLQVTVTDYCGNTASAVVEVEIEDTTPPSITVVMDRNALWPPNHKMVTCCADVTATDSCDEDPSVALVSIVSNEPDNAKGNQPGDIDGANYGTDDACFDLRSERLGRETARRYTIVYSATDAENNVAYDTVHVYVPHDQSTAALSSSGFAEDGASLNAGTTTFALFIPGSSSLEVRRIDATSIYVGNTAGIIRANEARMVDINNDQHADLAVTFDVSTAKNKLLLDGVDAAAIDDQIDARTINHGPVGLHFTTTDGTGYLVRNIYGLGAPVAMPDVTGKRIVTPDMQEKTGAAAAAPTEKRITALTSIHPNPFNPQTTVHFTLATTERVRIAIYDVTGALVRGLVDETMPAGEHRARWDGRNDAGTSVTSGVYFVRMMAGSFNEVRKIVMLK